MPKESKLVFSTPLKLLLTKLDKYIEIVLRVFAYTGGLIFFFMAVFTTYHIVMRYAFQRPVTALTNLSGFMMVVGMSLVMAYVALKNSNVTLTILLERLSKRKRRIFDIVIFIICLITMIVITYSTIKFGVSIISSGQTPATIKIPIYPFVIITGIGWGLFSIALLVALLRRWLRSE